MHIEIGQATQNIAANVRRKLLSDEVDWLLNKNQLRFIQSQLRPKKDGSGGFQVDQLAVDSFRSLLKFAELEAAITGTNEYTCQLPTDYSYLISDESRVNCPSGSSLEQITENILVIPLPPSTRTTAQFYQQVTLEIGNTVVTLVEIANVNQATYNGLKSKSEIFLIQDVILWYLRNVLHLPVYWEEYRSAVYPKSFLIPGQSSGGITIDEVQYNGQSKTLTYLKYPTFSTDKWAPNRLTQWDNVAVMLATPFMKPTLQSPISKLQGNKLIVHGHSSFIVSRVRVSYVKKPRRMHLLLGQDCELPHEFHHAICDLTTEYFKAMIADPNWQVKLQDNMHRSVPIQ